eukprot:CAMPEP_0118676776 /NCGR_PEP_ID=MMETSP0800-20121206/2240_1 /TAXON_ID=210618 ORGANISM="Striatella unipunctata, Strain CCMP2910" /NCGR_SAMPLE_ID=MMETSP0800 /ASSEMBLY_ACC=CAM_ASM_000638 /LENGTH=455 /DNA_ID=CAMNT_0006572337 /DNA_START=303 /DNA_END=1670 /DNA_ORIENTATION=-
MGIPNATVIDEVVDILSVLLGSSDFDSFDGIDLEAILERIRDLPPTEKVRALAVASIVVALFIDIRGNFDLLRASPNRTAHEEDLLGSLSGDNVLFGTPGNLLSYLRPGQVDYKGVVGIFGSVGNFFAARGGPRFYNERRFRNWLDACAEPSFGMDWTQASQLMGSRRRTTCEEEFAQLYGPYRTLSIFRDSEERPDPLTGRTRLFVPDSRLDDPIGSYRPAFIVAAIITGGTYDQLKQAEAFYNAAEFDNITWNPNFDDVKYGYFGNTTEMQTMLEGLQRDYPDEAITNQFQPLGQPTWADALYAGTIEPGLTHFVELPDEFPGIAFMGGWPDSSKTPALNMLEPDHTVVGLGFAPFGNFSKDALRLLGANESTILSLVDRETNSSFTIGLTAADARVCVFWSDISLVNITGFFNAGYNSLIETSDPFFSDTSYPNVVENINVGGCTPFVGPTT